jgi:hypothetical protein
MRVLCTQLSEHCASQLPKSRVNIGQLAEKEADVLPILDDHAQFIGSAAPSALCMKGRVKP